MTWGANQPPFFCTCAAQNPNQNNKGNDADSMNYRRQEVFSNRLEISDIMLVVKRVVQEPGNSLM